MGHLSGYFCRYAQGFLEPTSIRCRLDVQDVEPDRPINSEQRHNLFLAFKEALTNMVRHSGAAEVSIRIRLETSSRLFICIEDNGHGLPAVVETLRRIEGGERPEVPMIDRRSTNYTHPGISDYLKLRRVLKRLRDAAGR